MVHVSVRLMLFWTTTLCCQANKELDAPSSITNVIEYKIRSAFSNGGATAVKGVIFEELHKWKDLPINIGVTGNSGVGKSSFINAIRGLSAEDEGAAKVGVIETTQTMSSYQHPNNKNLLFWDLPGVGTPNFPQGNYLKAIQAEKFDYFIIMSADRFTENDLWLAKEMVNLRKAFYFVRSKVSQDIENDKKSHPKSHDKKSVLEVIRTNCNQNLQHIRSLKKPARVYLIDNYDVDNFDFVINTFN
ncbi:interferon-inducible GTPase 1-like [Mercenaria mercenaria]|uniref:interferon-inducible GTPase 1-like n=1 Tax=Mercenaria mercenaria TaxID=6596 RepID=UPI00234F9F07|nr:interferon-inducible GTPase 1-like [Mercenaria mercenaria]